MLRNDEDYGFRGSLWRTVTTVALANKIHGQADYLPGGLSMVARMLLGLVVVVAVCLAFWAIYAKPEKEVVSAVLAGALAVSAAIVGAGLSHYSAKTREVEESHRLHKIEVYTEFTDLIVESFSKVTKMKGLSEKERLVRQAEMMDEIRLDSLLSARSCFYGVLPKSCKNTRNSALLAKNRRTREIRAYSSSVTMFSGQ